jgi:hypothetical protein
LARQLEPMEQRLPCTPLMLLLQNSFSLMLLLRTVSVEQGRTTAPTWTPA